MVAGNMMGFTATDLAAYERQLALSKMAVMHQQMGGGGSNGGLYDGGYPGIGATQAPMYYQ